MPVRALAAFPVRASIAVTLAALLSALLLIAATPRSAKATAGTLYGVTGSRSGGCELTEAPPASHLYTIDPANDDATDIGAIHVDGTDVFHVTSLAIHPGTGAMYAIANTQNWANCDDWGTGTLLLIDPTDASAEVVGGWGSMTGGNFPDASFDPWGNLFVWGEGEDRLLAVNTTTGTTSETTPADCSTSETGLAIDSGGFRWITNAGTLTRVHHVSGLCRPWAATGGASNIAAFDANGVLWYGWRNQGVTDIYTYDPEADAGAHEATIALGNLAAIEWDVTGITPGGVADLRVSVEASAASAVIGDPVTFTVTVTNDGPDTATGIEVFHALPSVFSFDNVVASQGLIDPGAPDYWDVGSLAKDGSATVTFSTTAIGGGGRDWLGAEIRNGDQLDPDSVPWDNDYDVPEDDTALATVTVLDPDLDMAVTDLQVKGKLRFNSKGVGVNVVVTNFGVNAFSFDSASQLRLTWNDQSSRVTCRAVTTLLAPGKSATVRCKVNLLNSGVSPGATIVFRAELPLQHDFDESNNVRELTVTAS